MTPFNEQMAQVPGGPKTIPPTSVVTLYEDCRTRRDEIQNELTELQDRRNILTDRIDELAVMEQIVIAAIKVAEEYMPQSAAEYDQVPGVPSIETRPTKSYDHDRTGH